jgi:hypothetical protein
MRIWIRILPLVACLSTLAVVLGSHPHLMAWRDPPAG